MKDVHRTSTNTLRDYDYEFSEETKLIIEEYERKIRVKQVKLPKERMDNRIRWVQNLISEYDRSEQEYNMVLRIQNSHKYVKAIWNALDHGKLPENIKAEIKPKRYKDQKRCNVKQISKVIHLLKEAQTMGKKAFEKFLFIPDVNYILNVIEKNAFHDIEYLLNAA